ncbi:hypothetical protein FRZ61_04330 [Hypericibacter adhaerens]|jgi:hypothetical protein|uniref:Sulfite reductase n=1 Tax=Hypericibacter adhaerens TaxID=2602016 RepID=A0A5J6N0U4_9PROT|nr:DUF2849 domain-containing protein [Hypericibacter adhaerens]QEX20516.1 hypothetical protein FRZ61_04330 [Hypericibacter adhaerens]
MTAQIVTANNLLDGAVVYRTPEGRWTTHIGAAQGAAGEAEAKALLAQAEADALHQIVVGPYLVEVEGAPGHWEYKSWRERIRAEGPTVPHDFTPEAEPRRTANGRE